MHTNSENENYLKGYNFQHGIGCDVNLRSAEHCYLLALKEGSQRALEKLREMRVAGVSLQSDTLRAIDKFTSENLLLSAPETRTDDPTWKKLVEWDMNEMNANQQLTHSVGAKGETTSISADKSKKSALDEINELIGLDAVKSQMRRWAALTWYLQVKRQKGMKVEQPDLHMVFTGAPGTGKTTVARIVSKVLAESGILTKGYLVEASRGDLVAPFLGQTAPKTREKIESAFGGTLFIDEAYSLLPKDTAWRDPYGFEVITVLLQMMEDHRDKFAVILAGYPDEMESLLNANPGLMSRFRIHINFPDYTVLDLVKIFEGMCRKQEYMLEPEVIPMLTRHLESALVLADKRTWGNAREVRNIFQTAIEERALSLHQTQSQPSEEDLRTLTVSDFKFLTSRIQAVEKVPPRKAFASTGLLSDLEERAEHGDLEAQLLLGQVFVEGADGVPSNANRAKQLFEAAAKNGSVVAARELGRINELGLGVPVSLSKAQEWYLKSANAGDEYAEQALDRLYKKAGEGKESKAIIAVAEKKADEE